MIDKKDIRKKLLNGEELTLSNDSIFCSVDISHGKSLGGSDMFKIWMGASFIHMSTGFESFWRKLEQLINDNDLELEQ